MKPRCPECGSQAWSQIDHGPLCCMRCACEWLVVGMHEPAETVGATTLVLNHTIPWRES